MSSWDYELGALFRERDNPKTKIGNCFGKVLNTNPMEVSIQNGKYIIKGEQLYVAYHLLERKSTYSQMSQSGNISINCHPCNGSYTANCNGTITLDEVIKVDDLVLMIPSNSEQQWVIVDVIRKIKGCNSQSK
nr:MAG TPA: Protein of unknown function (DUF2577) [Caudoviricetes sp.]